MPLNAMMNHREIVDTMMQGDLFSQWLGIEILETAPGYARISMKVRTEMVNGFGICHGGISFSLADSVFAFASNSHGEQCVSIDTSINHLRPIRVDDILTATSLEINKGKSLRLYEVTICNQKNEKVAWFKGTVFNTGKIWERN
jgi:acyl-CoA thioesterase